MTTSENDAHQPPAQASTSAADMPPAWETWSEDEWRTGLVTAVLRTARRQRRWQRWRRVLQFRWCPGSRGPRRPRETPTILVVDDQPDVRYAVQAVLEAERFHVVTAVNGEEALRWVADLHPALVLLDLMMPVLDGWAVQRALQQRMPDLPVVLMSAHPHTQALAVTQQVAGYLTKPFQVEDLVRTVRRFTLSG